LGDQAVIDGGLRKLFQARLPHVHWCSVETGSTGRGIPDSNGCIDSHEFWVEFKATENYSVELRPEQVGWLLRRTRAGGRTFIAVRRKHDGGKRKGKPVDELWLYSGAAAKVLSELGLNKTYVQTLGIWSKGPAEWNWHTVGWWLQQ